MRHIGQGAKMKKSLICGAAIVAMVAISGCSKKPVRIEWGATSQSINNALLEERYSFVPKDKKLKESNWAYEVEAQAKGDYLFENNQMVKVFLLAHNADKIIILGEKNLALQYRNFSSKAMLDDDKEVNPLIINPIEEPNYPINSQSSRESINEY